MKERERQQALMSALLARDEGAPLRGHVSQSPQRLRRGMQAYQANAGASAERALATAFATVQALVGEESFAALARAYWHAQPPTCGDLACFGEGLPLFIAGSEQLVDVPYLPDVARLDWMLAGAERAADAAPEPSSFGLLAELDPAELRLELAPGIEVLASAYPIVSVWRVHQGGEDAAAHRAQARRALAEGAGENALVWRAGWRAQTGAIDASTARWMQSLHRGEALSLALDDAGEGFAFEPWLVQAVQQGWLLRVVHAG